MLQFAAPYTAAAYTRPIPNMICLHARTQTVQLLISALCCSLARFEKNFLFMIIASEKHFFFHLVYRKFFSSARSPFSCSGCSRMFECFYAKTEGWESERTWTQRKWHWPVAIMELRLLYFFCRFFVASRIRFWANATREKKYRSSKFVLSTQAHYVYADNILFLRRIQLDILGFRVWPLLRLFAAVHDQSTSTSDSSQLSFWSSFFVVFGESVSSSSCVR